MIIRLKRVEGRLYGCIERHATGVYAWDHSGPALASVCPAEIVDDDDGADTIWEFEEGFTPNLAEPRIRLYRSLDNALRDLWIGGPRSISWYEDDQGRVL